MHEDPRARSLRNKAAALIRWSQEDPRVGTEPARAAFLDSFRTKVIATAEKRGETLSPSEVERRAEALKRAHFVLLAAKSAQARKGGSS